MKIKVIELIKYVSPRDKQKYDFYKMNKYHHKAQALVKTIEPGTELDLLGSSKESCLVSINDDTIWVPAMHCERIDQST